MADLLGEMRSGLLAVLFLGSSDLAPTGNSWGLSVNVGEGKLGRGGEEGDQGEVILSFLSQRYRPPRPDSLLLAPGQVQLRLFHQLWCLCSLIHSFDVLNSPKA